RAERDEYFGLKEVRRALRRRRSQLLRPVELHAVDVMHRQTEDATEQTRIQLRHDHAARRVAPRHAATNDERRAVANRPHRLDRRGRNLSIPGGEVNPFGARLGAATAPGWAMPLA